MEKWTFHLRQRRKKHARGTESSTILEQPSGPIKPTNYEYEVNAGFIPSESWASQPRNYEDVKKYDVERLENTGIKNLRFSMHTSSYKPSSSKFCPTLRPCGTVTWSGKILQNNDSNPASGRKAASLCAVTGESESTQSWKDWDQQNVCGRSHQAGSDWASRAKNVSEKERPFYSGLRGLPKFERWYQPRSLPDTTHVEMYWPTRRRRSHFYATC